MPDNDDDNNRFLVVHSRKKVLKLNLYEFFVLIVDI